MRLYANGNVCVAGQSPSTVQCSIRVYRPTIIHWHDYINIKCVIAGIFFSLSIEGMSSSAIYFICIFLSWVRVYSTTYHKSNRRINFHKLEQNGSVMNRFFQHIIFSSLWLDTANDRFEIRREKNCLIFEIHSRAI